MSILIKGMEMPKEGQVIVIDSLGQVWTNEWPTRGYFRNEKAKAVPVPPHGRLIDADALYREIKAECNPYGKPSIGYDDGLKVLGIIGSTPPVIPAEEGE